MVKDILKALRKGKNLNQTEVAKYLNLSQQAYANYENGTTEPNLKSLIKLSKLYGVTTDYLLGLTSKPTTNDILTMPSNEEDLIFSMFEMYQNLTPDKRMRLNEIVEEILNQAGYEKKTLTDEQKQLIEKCDV